MKVSCNQSVTNFKSVKVAEMCKIQRNSDHQSINDLDLFKERRKVSKQKWGLGEGGGTDNNSGKVKLALV